METRKRAKKSTRKKRISKSARKLLRDKKAAKAKLRKPAAKVVVRARPPRSVARRKARGGRRVMPYLQPKTLGNPFETGLDRNPANYQSLTPLTFLERAARTFPDLTAIIHGNARTSYAEFYARARRLASALAEAGIRKGDTVSVMLANTPAMLEAHYGVPMIAPFCMR